MNDNLDQFNVLRKIKTKPNSSQRELASELGFSLGKLNYCLKALKEKGLIKIQNFTKDPNKLIEAIMHDYTLMHGNVIEDAEAWDPESMVGDEILDLTILNMAHIGTYNELLDNVTPPTVVWSTINYWRSFLTFKRNSFFASDAQKYLEQCFLRIGGALIPSIIPVADGAFTEEERKYREMKSA